MTITRTARISTLTGIMLVFLAGTTGIARAQPRPSPSPTPRRPLPKPAVTRGFEHFAHRDASARLIVGSATRPIIDPEDHYSKGEAHYRAGRYKEAVVEFREAVRLNPDHDDSHYILALVLTELEQLKEAIEEFRQVVKLANRNELRILSYYNIGNAHLDLAEYENAIDSYQQAIKLDPTLSKPHNNLGLAYAAVGKMNEAVLEFTESVRLKPDYAEAHYNLGVAYMQMKKANKAHEQQRILLKLNSKLAAQLEALLKT